VLGPTGRGEVAFLTAIAWFTSNLATLGVQEANANFAGSEPRLRRALATNSVLFALVLGLVTIAVLALLIGIFPAIGGPTDQSLRWLTFGAMPALILWIYLRFLVQAEYAFGVTNVAWLLTPVANVLVSGLLAVFGYLSVTTAVATWVGGQLAGTALLVWYVWRRLGGFGRPDVALARRTLSFGIKSHFGRVMLLGNYRLDQWILGAVSGAKELGLYSVAVAWAEALWYLPTAIAAVQRPDVVRAGKRDAVRQAAGAFRIAAVLTAALAGVMILAAPFLCVTIFGPEFSGAIDDLRVLALGGVGIVALKQLGSALTGQRKPTLASIAIGVSFVSTVVLDILLIPAYAGIGAAIASTISYTAGGLAVAFMFTYALDSRLRDLVPRLGEVVEHGRTVHRLVRHRGRHVPEPAGDSRG
jgi:O-antigen/teichoic acid export membrane protein